MSRPNFEDLTISKQYRSEIKPYFFEEFISYDTETYKGKAVLICDSKGEYIYPTCLEECLAFLTRRKYRGVIGWFLNIDHDIESILKWSTEEDTKEWIKNDERTDYCNQVDTVHIKLIRGKMLIMNRNKYSFKFYDIGNFYKGGLDRNARKYLGEEKIQISVNWETVTLDYLKSTECLVYCKQDARLTEGLARNFIKTCNGFGLYTSNFCSPASIATHHFLSKVEIPTLSSITKGNNLRTKIAYESYKGGFIQTFKRGYFENVYLYDINSAYPFWIANLPDMSKGKMVLSVGKVPKNAKMGWLRVEIETPINDLYNPWYYNPCAVYLKKFNKNFYFAGKFYTTITLMEYQRLSQDFKIKPLQGYYWIPEQEIEYLYRDEIYRLYELRNQNRDDENLNLLIKLIMNGYYGKLIQKIPKKTATDFEYTTGNLFNPFHASYITAGCRMQVYNFIAEHGAHDLIAVMTDGIAMTRKIPVDSGKILGQWSLDMEGEGVFIGSGLYTIKNETKTKTATRGFKFTEKIDFFKLLAQNLNNEKIEFPQKVRLSYKEAIRTKQFENWNIIKEGLKNIGINCDTKRRWQRNFKNCRDVLENVIDSIPIIVDMKG